MKLIVKRHRRGYIKLKGILVIFFILGISLFLINKITRDKVNINLEDLAAFRIPSQSISDINSLSEINQIDFYEALAVFLIEESFFPKKNIAPTKEQIDKSLFRNYSKLTKRYSGDKLKNLTLLLKNIISEIVFFPIPQNAGAQPDELYIYGDSWGVLREYGGKRKHEGVDIMDRDNIRGRIPIVSMTDGIIENLGWNEKGGWRVGVRTSGGTYFYYAHLDSYSEALEEGMNITAGMLLGFMGNSGYSKKEGTVGKFSVHLHLGIMPTTKLSKDNEFWINPYPILRLIESKKIELTAN